MKFGTSTGVSIGMSNYATNNYVRNTLISWLDNVSGDRKNKLKIIEKKVNHA